MLPSLCLIPNPIFFYSNASPLTLLPQSLLQLFDEEPYLEELMEYLGSVEVRYCVYQRRCSPSRLNVLLC